MLVKVETNTFREHSVRAGYIYDDATMDVLEFWCENDTGLKMTMQLPDPLNDKERVAMEFRRDDEKKAEDVKGLGLKLAYDVDGNLALPVDLEMSYAWQ